MREPEPTRQYLFTADQIRLAAVALTTLLVLALVALLLLTTARPQGRFAPVYTAQFEETLLRATEDLDGFRELENGAVQLDIDHAIELVASRGVASPFTTAVAQAPADDAAEAAAEAGGDDAAVADAGLPDGATVYNNCSACHQGNGQGVPGAFPTLAGHAADLYEADPGYLANVVLFGLQGQITVDGMTYNGLMPAWGQLSDPQIAAVLNYILASWGNEQQVAEPDPYTAEFIAEQRALGLTMQEVYEQRQELGLE